MTETINITPKWKHLIHIMIEVLQNPRATTDSKKEIRAELVRMAEIVDQMNEDKIKNG